MVLKGLPLVEQQNYIGSVLKWESFHFGGRDENALTASTRGDVLRQGQEWGMMSWFGIYSRGARWKEEKASI